MADEITDLSKIANLLALLVTKDMNKAGVVATLEACGFSNKEIAGLIGTTENSVRAMRSKAHKAQLQ